MRLKFFKKYFTAITAIVVVSITVMMIILTFLFSNLVSGEKYDSLHKACESVVSFSEITYEGDNSSEYMRNIYFIMKNISAVNGFDLFLTDSSGNIRVCSCDNWQEQSSCDHTGTVIGKEYLLRMTGENSDIFATLDIYSSPRYATADTLKTTSGKEYGYIISTASASVVKMLLAEMGRIYLLSAIVPIVFMIIALYVMSYRLTTPLKLMSEAARAMARGDFSRRIPVTTDDEIGELAVSFNQMTNSLARLEDMRKSFVANISHELKTPMTTIGGFIDGILDGTIEPERQSYYLGVVAEEVKRLSRMVESMLSLSRLESGAVTVKAEEFDFREQILSIVIGQEQRIEQKNINIVGLDELPSVIVNADKDLIYNVVYNLVDNAVKFTDESGTISFSIKLDSKNIGFTIKNTGKGIPKAELPYVFDRFYKVDKSRSANKTSTGLGLYIVKTIIKNHGGSISVSSVENEFTAFEFLLPR